MTGTASSFRPASLALATVGLSLGTFMQVLDITIANVSLPTIAGNLGASQDQSTWVITSFTVCQAITLPMTGFLSRRFGQVRVFISAVLLFSLFSLACGLSVSLPMLVMFRALQGAVCGPMYPITQSLMVSIYPHEKRAMALAIISMITVVAPIVGPVAGGWITDSYSWRWIFFINVPIGMVAALLVVVQMGKRIDELRRGRIDWVGVATLILGVGSLQILLDRGNELDWFNSTTIRLLAAVAVVALTVFVIWELTDDQPVVDLRLFRHRNFAAGTFALVLAFGLFFAVSLLLPLWMQNTLGYTALWSGLAVAPIGIIPVLLTFWVGKYAARMDLRWLTALSFAVMGYVCLRIGGFTTEVGFWSIAWTELVMGLGVALFFMPILTILLSDLEGSEIAEGSGSATFLRTVGASFAVSIITYLWTRGASASHAHLVEFITVSSAQVRQGIEAAGSVDRYAAMMNGIITQQSMQISFNQMFNALGFCFFALIAVVWLSRPPFVRQRARPP
ncbi:DHA2 family efflux MFS transporter permease subunit [Castellaniella sp.]|uniref:DHA2 family efflux MFS transporter permease subunit n=1 Tax=Castellaniella sp. TaxID=1955812 RepID=UPI0025C344A2|nr:DHA2 family efflux MFS transporter permease subunit [Castellaniella sp.]